MPKPVRRAYAARHKNRRIAITALYKESRLAERDGFLSFLEYSGSILGRQPERAGS